MKTETMAVRQALEQGLVLPFSLIRSLSRVTLGPTPSTVDPDGLLEARFFSAEEEIRVFSGADGLQAAQLTAEPGDVSLKQTYQLMNSSFGTEVTLSREIGFDGDGQAYVSTTRLTGWKGGRT